MRIHFLKIKPGEMFLPSHFLLKFLLNLIAFISFPNGQYNRENYILCIFFLSNPFPSLLNSFKKNNSFMHKPDGRWVSPQPHLLIHSSKNIFHKIRNIQRIQILFFSLILVIKETIFLSSPKIQEN